MALTGDGCPCARGDPIRARRYYQESLALRRELGDQAGTAACLEGLAGTTGQLQHAARLLGAATALRNSIGAAWLPTDVPEYERKVATLRALLGEAAFAAA